MELLDIYNKNREKTGRTINRDDSGQLKPGEYIAVGGALLINPNGQILLSKRSMTKPSHPGLWELNGGCYQAGEEGNEAIVREVREEIGVNLDPKKGALLKTAQLDKFFKDLWAFRIDVDISDLTFDTREVAEAKWASIEELISLRQNGAMIDSNQVSIEDYQRALEFLNIK